MKKTIGLVFLFAILLTLTGCAGNSSSENAGSISSTANASSSVCESEAEPDVTESTLVICMPNTVHPFFKIFQMGFIEKAQELGYDNIVVSGADNQGTYTYDELFEIWCNDIEKCNPKGVVMWAGADDTHYDIMRKLSEKGVAVIITYFAHDYEDCSDFVCANPAVVQAEGQGKLAAIYLAAELENRGIASGMIGMSYGGNDDTGFQAFRNQFFELLQGLTVIEHAYSGVTADECLERIEDYIRKNPQIVAAFGAASGDGAGWANAKKNLGREDIITIAVGSYPNNISFLMEGELDALFADPLYEGGERTAEMLDEALHGKVFSESEWQPTLPAHFVTVEGEGKNGPQYYLDLFDRIETFDWDKYMV